MEKTAVAPFALRRLIMTAAIAVAAAITMASRADAQAVIIVNGDPVTQFDIEQRAKLIQLSSKKAPARTQVIEELINEKLKIQLLKRFAIEGVDRTSTLPTPTWRGGCGQHRRNSPTTSKNRV